MRPVCHMPHRFVASQPVEPVPMRDCHPHPPRVPQLLSRTPLAGSRSSPPSRTPFPFLSSPHSARVVRTVFVEMLFSTTEKPPLLESKFHGERRFATEFVPVAVRSLYVRVSK